VFGARRLSSESHEDRAFESNCSKAAKAVVSNGRRLLSFNEGEPIETYWAKAESSGAELRYLSDRVLFEARVGDRLPKTQGLKRGKWARKGLGLP
jgi:hypothetical protein